MNTIVTSREEILKTSRELLRRDGWSAIHIRGVAAACGVSVGSIYNYFHAKSELVGAVVESVWCDIFRRAEGEPPFPDTCACITWLYRRMEYGAEEYPGFFTLHAMPFLREEKADGKARMERTWDHVLRGLTAVLKRDPNIRPGAFDDTFTAEKFADVLFSLMLSALLRQDYDPATVLELLRRTLY